MPRKDTITGPISAQAQQDLVSEGIENFELPKSLVMKIAKSAIPENAKLQKEAVLSLVKGSTVFINYLAANAHDVALLKQHKSISASDVLKALEMIEFGNLVDSLQDELQIYRELAKTDKSKKSSSNVLSSSAVSAKKLSGVGTPSTSVSAIAMSKGKEIEIEMEQDQVDGKAAPFTSAPISGLPAGDSVSFSEMPMDVDKAEDEGGSREEVAEHDDDVDEAGDPVQTKILQSEEVQRQDEEVLEDPQHAPSP